MKRIYPWELWLNGEEWVLVRGEDFEVSSHGMQASVYTYVARNCTGTLKSWRDRDVLSIQFIPAAQ